MNTTHGAGRVLVVDDEERIRTILAAILKDEHYEVATASDGIEAMNKIGDFAPQVAIVDLQMPRMSGMETIERMMQVDKRIVIVVLTAHGSIQSAVQVTKHGVYDYLTKPFDNEQMLHVIRRAMQHHQLAAEVNDLKKKLGKQYGLESIVGESEPMRKVREEIKRIANTDAAVLIEGESGTGKELAARAIHYESLRNEGPLVVVDCGSVPISIIESEFFGHERGAFTDARDQRIGRFEEANSGSIFLDEIGELPMDAQTKLLRVLQEKEFMRVGGSSPVRVDVRVIAASNKNLEEQMKNGRFREDLFYRLNVLRLLIPPLRERKEDIPTYANYFVEKHKDTIHRGTCTISDEAIQVLMSHDWGGNVRELENAIQRAMLSMKNNKIQASDFSFLSRRDIPNTIQFNGEDGMERYIKSLVENSERDIIIKVLRETDWNRINAATKLKVSRKTLFNKMQQYKIDEKTER